MTCNAVTAVTGITGCVYRGGVTGCYRVTAVTPVRGVTAVTNPAEPAIAKQRNGPTGTCALRFHGPTMRFTDATEGAA